MSGLIWDYYDKLPGEKVAKCRLCKKQYSYKTSISNLKKHLYHKHPSAYKIFIDSNPAGSTSWPKIQQDSDNESESEDNKDISQQLVLQRSASAKTKPTSGLIWDYYNKLPGETVAKCRLCQNEYSYKTSTSNLKKHLFHKHPIAYKNLLESIPTGSSSLPKIQQDSDNESVPRDSKDISQQLRLQLQRSAKAKIKSKSGLIWDYYDKLPGETVAKCKLCKNEYSYKTTSTNLKKHLRYKHVSTYQNFLKSNSKRYTAQSTASRRTSSTCTPETQQVSDNEVSDNEVSDNESMPEGSEETSQQPFKISILRPASANIQTVRPCTQRKQQKPVFIYEKRDKIIDKKLLLMITQDYQPLSIVEDMGFKSFVEALNPSYELPNRKFISGTLIPEWYLECKNQIMNLIQNAKAVCLTTDYWTSITMDAYLAVTAHFLIDFELKTVMLHCEHFSGSPSADALAAALTNIASTWNVTDKITLVVSNNAGNLTNAIHKTGWPYFGCFLHKLNLVIEEAILVIDFILELVKKIVDHFKKNSLATATLIQYQIVNEEKSEALRLIQSDPIRWNSVFYMLERFIELQHALQAYIPNTDLPIVTVEIWEAIKQVCIILRPFEEITRVMCDTKYLSASLAIVIIDGLKNVISIMKTKPIFGVARHFLCKLEEGMLTYFPENEVEDDMLFGICTFLDPRFKSHAFVEDFNVLEEMSSEQMSQSSKRACVIKEHVLELLKIKLRDKKPLPVVEVFLELPQTWSSNEGEDIKSMSIWRKIDKNIAAITPVSDDDITTKAKIELNMFLRAEVVQRESSPLAWWKAHASIYPNLAEIFNETCHTVVTSVECEKVFSKAGIFFTHKRAQLSRKHTTELVFLKSNEAYCK